MLKVDIFLFVKKMICELPEEVLLQIFGHLTTFEILQKIALVCKKFYRLSKDPYLIKEVILHPKTTGCPI